MELNEEKDVVKELDSCVNDWFDSCYYNFDMDVDNYVDRCKNVTKEDIKFEYLIPDRSSGLENHDKVKDFNACAKYIQDKIQNNYQDWLLTELKRTETRYFDSIKADFENKEVPSWKIIKSIECYMDANKEAFNLPPYYSGDVNNLLNDDIIDEDTWDLIQQNKALKDILKLAKNPYLMDRNLELYGVDPTINPYQKLEDYKDKECSPKEIFGNLDINYSGSLEKGYYTITFFTNTASQDCNFELEFEPNDFNSFTKACAELKDSYDVEDQVALYLEAKQNGLTGVPDVETLLEDCKEVKNTLDKLALQAAEQNGLRHVKKPNKANNSKKRVVDSIKPEKPTKSESLGSEAR